MSWVDGEYFDTLAVPLLRGRTFDAADSLTVSACRGRERRVRAHLLAGKRSDRTPVQNSGARRPRVRGRRRRGRLQGGNGWREADALHSLRADAAILLQRGLDRAVRDGRVCAARRDEARGAGDRAAHGVHRRPADGRTGGRGAAAGAPRRSDGHHRRARRDRARGNRFVRRHRVRGRAANPRDRHPDGARRRASAA